MGDGGHTLFDTAIGVCGIAWGQGGVVAVQLPEADAARTRARLLIGLPPLPELSPPPATVQAAIEGIQALLMGEARDLREVPLDMTRLTPFQREVYAMARAIPPGQTRTYGEMAQALGDAGLARAVGQALGHNPFAPVVPCHRVLAAGARSGGFSARGGVATKLRMLQIEGAQIGGEPGLFDGDGA
ncbi:MAG: methylated-DNA--[protein]-cysteine S-methyltransferase [Hydrogenophaga sp.]|uniref:methylated-DNA--[protein]-cysteine S-methyltransferase n=1 Tax=Hydrogenophaga aromaticivorans TaxID=2610898 RepID=UPI001B376C61|nr:methylated-DNA--[protein]-cysteine S-methyltransferase [Hydrogenophaga aromaticivorans]MBQ0919958.1 methylated-DNA--[protein]-cysteine S-methyltransferase [Hydrogenophaga aromaticivorans]MDO9292439.1 methylated-DNA--[protein]-cysteine S-methyltransferase [Hydrogenophaga sp.]